jgi:hypothetical protein
MPHGLDLAELIEHLHALAAGARDQDEADRWRRLAGLWCRDPTGARSATAEWVAEIENAADPATTAAFLRMSAVADEARTTALLAEAARRTRRRWRDGSPTTPTTS